MKGKDGLFKKVKGTIGKKLELVGPSEVRKTIQNGYALAQSLYAVSDNTHQGKIVWEVEVYGDWGLSLTGKKFNFETSC